MQLGRVIRRGQVGEGCGTDVISYLAMTLQRLDVGVDLDFIDRINGFVTALQSDDDATTAAKDQKNAIAQPAAPEVPVSIEEIAFSSIALNINLDLGDHETSTSGKNTENNGALAMIQGLGVYTVSVAPHPCGLGL